MLLQGDFKGAEAAFTKVTIIDPSNPDGWVNIGRVRVQEGKLDGARKVLETALKLSPALARANYFYARVLRQQGDYDGAIAHLQSVLLQYPQDRVVQDDLGRVYFLKHQYADAVQAFGNSLAIDPEDLEANYNLMLSYTGLGDKTQAEAFEKRSLRFKADEASQALTGPYREKHPADNLELQPIHEHESVPLPNINARSVAGRSSTNSASLHPPDHADRSRSWPVIKSRLAPIPFALALFLAMQLAFAGPPSSSDSTTPAGAKIRFVDITRAAGIHFTHNNGASGKKYLPETLGPGVAFIDYDNDGWQDIYLVNGTNLVGHAGRATMTALYRKNHDGTFTDVTRRAGLATEMFGMGVAVGDFDNDGYDDLFVTAYGQNHLFHNNGNGTFTDVTKKAGLWGPQELSASAASVDYDRDGRFDLVVANYVQWAPERDLYCSMDGKQKSYCTPEFYKGTSVRLWHNRGDGTFEDVTTKAGLYNDSSKSLGVAVLDVNQDGWPDLAISNDTQPNKLYINNKNGTFTEQAILAGVAYSEDGVARAGMGVDAADYDHSGSPEPGHHQFLQPDDFPLPQ